MGAWRAAHTPLKEGIDVAAVGGAAHLTKSPTELCSTDLSVVIPIPFLDEVEHSSLLPRQHLYEGEGVRRVLGRVGFSR